MRFDSFFKKNYFILARAARALGGAKWRAARDVARPRRGAANPEWQTPNPGTDPVRGTEGG